jgi:hypothetical protein
LYDQRLNRFLAQSRRTPLVRYLDLPYPPHPLAVEGPLRLLVMISSPTGYPPLDVEQEWSLLTEALAEQQEEGRVIIERLAANMGMLRQRLRQEEFHVFHFVGHGLYRSDWGDGVLVMEDRDGRAREVTGEELGSLLNEYDPTRLAVLNACEGARTGASDPFAGVAQSLIQQGLPAVVAMQFAITDDAAIIFSRELYGAIADSYPLEAALAEARGAIRDEGNATEWGTPVLYSRAPDGHLFEVTRQARQQAQRQAREEAEARQAREEAERQAREQADRQAREQADRQAREDEARQAKEEADRQAREQADRQAREDEARQAKEEADRQAREHQARQVKGAAELGAEALNFLANIEKLQAGIEPIAVANPTDTGLASLAHREPEAPGAIVGPLRGEAMDQFSVSEESLSGHAGWMANLIQSKPFSRILMITLDHETHKLEIKRRVIDSILLDGKVIAKGYDIAEAKIRTFSIPDGQQQRRADVWIDVGTAYKLTKIKVIVDSHTLYEE